MLAIALAAASASASKYLIAYRGRHIVNPAAFGVLFVTLLQLSGGVWWVATAPMLPAVAGLALLIAYRHPPAADRRPVRRGGRRC